MSQKTLSMRKIRELRRLTYELGRSHREIRRVALTQLDGLVLGGNHHDAVPAPVLRLH